MDRPVGERLGERAVDETVLVDECEPREPPALHRHLEVVAAARPVDDGHVGGVGERRPQELLEPVCRVGRAQLRLTSLKKRLSSPLAVSSW